jgi:GNAT superfamily N-acetyltransferase/predicted nucleic acid-binding protein
VPLTVPAGPSGAFGPIASVSVSWPGPQGGMLVSQVVALAAECRDSLPPLPVEVATELAARGGLAIALVDGMVAGYLAYRLPRHEVRILQVCVRRQFRRRGLARRLVMAVHDRHADRLGTGVRCRQTHPADPLWPALGFSHAGSLPLAPAPGDGPDRAPAEQADTWWRGHDLDLLFTGRVGDDPLPVPVALGSDVFADLHARREAGESAVLRSDWLRGEIELVTTSELLREIGGHPDEAESSRLRRTAQNYRFCATDNVAVDEMAERLVERTRARLGRDLTESLVGQADARFIAQAGEAGVHVLVTRDPALLGLSAVARDLCDVRIVRPAELLLDVDAIRDTHTYRPADVIEVSYSVREAGPEDDRLLMSFLDLRGGERIGDFQRRQGDEPDREPWSRRLVLDHMGEPAAYVVSRCSDAALEVSLIRVGPRRGATLARQILAQLRVRCREVGAARLLVDDPFLPDVVRDAALEDGFQRYSGALLALVVEVCGTAAEAQAVIAAASSPIGLRPAILRCGLSAAVAAGVERAYWPAKIIDSHLPTFVLPIRAELSTDLFRWPAAGEVPMSRLGPSRAQVYYRAPHGSRERAPGRVLWLLERPDDPDGDVVFACSRLEEVVHGTPDELHRRFRHLGVWTRSEVRAAVDGSGFVLGLVVADTEVFPRPVPTSRVAALGTQSGQPFQPRCAQELPSDVFAAVYREAGAL